MPPVFWLLILLVFPLAEVFVMWQLAHEIGWWLLVLLLVSAVAGMALLRRSPSTFIAAAVGELMRGGSPARALAAGATPLLAAVLLIFPGVISDVLAIFLLLWTAFRSPPSPPRKPGDDGVIEGVFYREE